MPDAFLDAMSVADKTASWSASLGREESRGKRTLVVEVERAVVGYATAGPDSDSDRGMLLLMYVLPQHWGRGCGRLLMRETREALKDLGYQEAVLGVLEENARARRFYKADGWLFDETTQVVEYGGAELVALRMVASL